jgi:hypothetical protein
MSIHGVFLWLFAKLLGARNRGRARADMRVPMTGSRNVAKIDFQIENVPADGT